MTIGVRGRVNRGFDTFGLDVKIEGIDELDAALDVLPRVYLHNFIDLAWNTLVDTTPVDTGTARASWEIAPNFGSVNYVPYQEYDRPVFPKYDLDLDTLILGSNNSWMFKLNEGGSWQAPAFFIEAAVEFAVDFADTDTSIAKIKKSVEYARRSKIKKYNARDRSFDKPKTSIFGNF